MSLWCCCCCCEPEDSEHLPLLRSQDELRRNDGFPSIKSSHGYEHVEDIEGAPTGKKWYHGGITYREAEYRLRSSSLSVDDGTYLVYDNPMKRGEYVLLVYCKGRFYKWKIIRRPSDGMYVLGENRPGVKTYKSVSKLIKHHRGVTGKPIKLEHGGTVKLNDYVYVSGPGAL